MKLTQLMGFLLLVSIGCAGDPAQEALTDYYLPQEDRLALEGPIVYDPNRPSGLVESGHRVWRSSLSQESTAYRIQFQVAEGGEFRLIDHCHTDLTGGGIEISFFSEGDRLHVHVFQNGTPIIQRERPISGLQPQFQLITLDVEVHGDHGKVHLKISNTSGEVLVQGMGRRDFLITDSRSLGVGNRAAIRLRKAKGGILRVEKAKAHD